MYLDMLNESEQNETNFKNSSGYTTGFFSLFVFNFEEISHIIGLFLFFLTLNVFKNFLTNFKIMSLTL